MSAVLGPIHYWLFNKIKIQDTLVEAVVRYGTEKYGSDIMNGIEKFGEVETESLENIIDGTNIHGWLQERVSIVENRLAFAVTAVLGKESIDNLEQIFFCLGSKVVEVPEQTDARAVYRLLNDSLLDGMPCDHANSIVEEDDNTITYKRNVCVHEEYWNGVGTDVSVYYTLRKALIKGMLENTNVSLQEIDEVTNQLVTK